MIFIKQIYIKYVYFYIFKYNKNNYIHMERVLGEEYNPHLRPISDPKKASLLYFLLRFPFNRRISTLLKIDLCGIKLNKDFCHP